MNAEEWKKAMDPGVPWVQAYATVEREARRFLTGYKGQLETTVLVDELYPRAGRLIVDIAVRKRIVKALMALATHGLADCCHRGESTWHKGLKRPIRPWIWHAPIEERRCPSCGQLVF